MVVIPFIIFPNYLFKPKIIKTDFMGTIVDTLNNTERQKTLENIWGYIVDKHYGFVEQGFIKKMILSPNLFKNKIENIDKSIILFCHTQNLYIKTLLVNSSQFDDADIKIKWVISKNFIIHQYLLLSFDDKKIKIDPFFKICEVIYS